MASRKKSAPAKKTAKKTAAAKKTAPAKKTAASKKPAPAKKTAAAKKVAKKPSTKKASAKKPAVKKPKVIDLKSKLAKLTSRRGTGTKSVAAKKAQPLVFTIEDAREELERLEQQREEVLEAALPVTEPKAVKKPKPAKAAKKKAQVVGAASIMDLLGFDPSSNGSREEDEKSKIPKKWMPYYNSLVELRQHFKDELDIHTKDTLTLDGKEDHAGYGQEQTDSDSGQFDREVALNMLASEQDALYEVERAITRILEDRYGICEITGKPIKKSRLSAVPFTRYSLEGQQQFESGKRRGGGVRGKDELFIERDEDTSRMLTTDDAEE